MKILAIEDEKLLLDHYQRLLEKQGHKVMTSLDVNDAVKEFIKAHEDKDPFDVILLDFILPRYEGSVALQHFRELEKEYSLKKTPVIIISGQEELKNVLLLQRLGIEEYIVKNPDLDKRLLQALEHIYNK